MNLRYIDLFAGAGGLSEGFLRAGYKPVAHVEMDEAACRTLRTRAAYHYLKQHSGGRIYKEYLQGKITSAELYAHVPEEILNSVIRAEISDETLPDVFRKIDELRDGKNIDLIIGGPPCQVYSLVGRSRIGAEKARMDIRYTLYKQYAEFLKHYKPRFFVFENVVGLLSADNGDLINTIRQVLKDCGYLIDYRVLNSADYGILQERKRIILIGSKGQLFFEYPDIEKRRSAWKIKDALFSDLPFIKQGGGQDFSSYRNPEVNAYLKETGIRNGTPDVFQHVTRPHNDRDLEIYSIAIKKWIHDKERLKYSDLPSRLKTHKNEKSFLDRFKVIDPNGVCHTVVAHLSKDGHHFIYPDAENPRSVSVREAARIQSFPDDFFFEGGRSGAFRQIGNAVPPLLGYVIANEIKKLL